MEGLCFEVGQAKVSETLYLKTSQAWWINPIIPNTWDHLHLRPVQAKRKERGRESKRARARERERETETETETERISARSYLKNNLKTKGPAVWLKCSGSMLA
jgi:hypothetical protein